MNTFSLKELMEYKAKNSIINQLDLTEEQILKIVQEWYLSLESEIFMNDDGEELDEFIDNQLYN